MVGRRVLRGVLLAVVLVTGVVLGLLGMHALDTHGTPGGHTLAGHSAPALAHTSASDSPASDAADTAVVPGDPAGDGGAACVLALLGGLLLLLRPSRLIGTGPLLRALRSPVDASAGPLRPPSLHVLCISRT